MFENIQRFILFQENGFTILAIEPDGDYLLDYNQMTVNSVKIFPNPASNYPSRPLQKEAYSKLSPRRWKSIS